MSSEFPGRHPTYRGIAGGLFWSEQKAVKALTIPGLGAALSAIAAGALGGYALTQRDRSIFVILAIVVGMAVLFCTTAEIVFPH